MTEVRVIAELDALTAAERALFDTAAPANVFSSLEWYRNFITTVVGGSSAVRILVATDAQGATAILPLWVKPRTLFKPRRLDALANYYCCLYEPIVCADRDRATAGLQAMVRHLVTDLNDWDTIDLTPMDGEAWHYHTLQAAFLEAGMLALPYTAFGNWYLEAQGLTFDAYFNARKKKMRSTVRSKTKQLQEAHETEFELLAEAGPALDRAIADYEAVYAVSWKQAEPYPAFMPGLIRTLAARGWLRLGILRVAGRPSAVQLWTVCGPIASIYKLAYDPEFAQFSVGTLLSMRLMEHVLGVDKVSCVDFLSGDDEYKEQWMSHRRERKGLEIINTRTVRGNAVRARRWLGRLKRRLRERLGH